MCLQFSARLSKLRRRTIRTFRFSTGRSRSRRTWFKGGCIGYSGLDSGLSNNWVSLNIKANFSEQVLSFCQRVEGNFSNQVFTDVLSGCRVEMDNRRYSITRSLPKWIPHMIKRQNWKQVDKQRERYSPAGSLLSQEGSLRVTLAGSCLSSDACWRSYQKHYQKHFITIIININYLNINTNTNINITNSGRELFFCLLSISSSEALLS